MKKTAIVITILFLVLINFNANAQTDFEKIENSITGLNINKAENKIDKNILNPQLMQGIEKCKILYFRY